MIVGEALTNTLVDELNELGLPQMAATLDALYHSERFLNLDHLSLIAEMVESEYQSKVTRRLNSRLRQAKLLGSPEHLSECKDSTVREYFPTGITGLLSSLSFIDSGMNICILGPSDSGKTYFAKALGIAACDKHKVEYHHCEPFLESIVSMKALDFTKYERRIKAVRNLDLLILDDFLLHTITDEREIKVLFTVLENRCESHKSTIVCSQREPKSWSSMILNDEVSANAILKRATKHYTVVINSKQQEQ